MQSFVVGAAIAIACLAIPLLGFIFYTAIFFVASPYFRNVFIGSIGLKGEDRVKKLIGSGLAPHLFLMMMALSVTFSLILELFFVLVLSPLALFMDIKVVAVAHLVLAGPIEESMKLIVAALSFVGLYLLLSWGKVMDRPYGEISNVKNGMIIGLLTGASFGMAESVLYLFSGLSSLSSGDTSALTIDAVVWRVILGVIVHAVYCGVASSGLGRTGWARKVLFTMAGLSLAVLYHSLNNGVSGVMQFFSGLEVSQMLLVTDIIQSALFIMAVVTLVLLWKFSAEGTVNDRT
jgi:hypothetical protein